MAVMGVWAYWARLRGSGKTRIYSLFSWTLLPHLYLVKICPFQPFRRFSQSLS